MLCGRLTEVYGWVQITQRCDTYSVSAVPKFRLVKTAYLPVMRAFFPALPGLIDGRAGLGELGRTLGRGLGRGLEIAGRGDGLLGRGEIDGRGDDDGRGEVTRGRGEVTLGRGDDDGRGEVTLGRGDDDGRGEVTPGRGDDDGRGEVTLGRGDDDGRGEVTPGRGEVTPGRGEVTLGREVLGTTLRLLPVIRDCLPVFPIPLGLPLVDGCVGNCALG